MKTAKPEITKRNQFNRFILIGGVVIAIVVLGTFTGIKVWIKIEANSIANHAIEIFQKNNIESLIAVIDANNYTLKEKNEAIWALGIFKDERALPKLESLFSGEPCDHNSSLCQREIGKAINKINNDFKSSLHKSN